MAIAVRDSSQARPGEGGRSPWESERNPDFSRFLFLGTFNPLNHDHLSLRGRLT